LHPSINWAEKESHVDEDEMAKVKTAFVGNLPANVTEEYLRKLFEHCGEVCYAPMWQPNVCVHQFYLKY
jgi:RNA recognition motif-containing protein